MPEFDLPRAFRASQRVNAAISDAVAEMHAAGVPRDRILCTLAGIIARSIFTPNSNLTAEDLGQLGEQVAAFLGHPLSGAIPLGRA